MSRSPGVKRLVAAFVLSTSVAVAEQAPRFATAEEAVAARAWHEAARLWQLQAEAGSAEAYMGLGNLWDLGVLGERDLDAALAYYRKAADAGLPQGAFNVGAMYATGSGKTRDLEAAATWYALAAFHGYDRAAFALGTLFAEGKAMPGNAHIAAAWLRRAARTIPAAQDSLGNLGAEATGPLNPPVPLTFRILDTDGQRRAHVAWYALPGPEDAVFRVEIAGMDAGGRTGSRVLSLETRGGFAALDLPNEIEDPIWRVLMVDGDDHGADYASTGWVDYQFRPVNRSTVSSVRVQTETGNDRARRRAESVARGLQSAGLPVTFGDVSEQPAFSTVRYKYGTDEPFARDIARFLPAVGPSRVERDPSLQTAPGEVVVSLAVEGMAAGSQSDN